MLIQVRDRKVVAAALGGAVLRSCRAFPRLGVLSSFNRSTFSTRPQHSFAAAYRKRHHIDINSH